MKSYIKYFACPENRLLQVLKNFISSSLQFLKETFTSSRKFYIMFLAGSKKDFYKFSISPKASP